MNHYESAVVQDVLSRTLCLEAAALSVKGRERTVNEDTLFHYTGQIDTGECIGLYVLCDGTGGDEASEIASQMAIQTMIAELGKVFVICDSPAKPNSIQLTWLALHQWTRTAVANANRKIWDYAQTRLGPAERSYLATTVTLMLIHGDLAGIAHVGNSRTYVWRNGELTQLTRDHHSLATVPLQTGHLTEEHVATSPHRNLITRALGVSEGVEVDLFEWKVCPGDRFLLCSDGLWSAFPDRRELRQWLGSAVEPAVLCRQLVDEANRRTGSDDTSAIAVYVNE